MAGSRALAAAEGLNAGRPVRRLAGVRRPGLYAAAFAVLALALLAGTAIGPVRIAPADVLRVLLRHVLHVDAAVPALADTIIWDIRLPRVVLAAAVGGTLAFSGAAYQGVFRNPLADPYLLGVASGAGFAAALVIVGPLPLAYGHVSLVTLAALAGAVLATGATYLLARVGGSTPVTTLILAGIAVSALAVSATSYLMLANQEDSIRVLSWLLGSFNNATWGKLWFILPYAVPAATVIFLHGRLLNVMQLDEQQASQLGVDVERTRLLILLAASLAAAAAVAVAGIIGFVGLVVPHVVRLIAGPDYRRLLPLSAIAGAAFLVLADLGARVLASPQELPVGVVTAFVGAPYFLYLLRRQGRAYF